MFHYTSKSVSTALMFFQKHVQCVLFCFTDLEFINTQSESEAAIEFVEILLRYLMRTALPYEGIPFEDGISDLSHATWFNLGECILLFSQLLGESSDSIKSDIAHSMVALPGACRAVHLAVEMGSRSGGIL